MGTRSTTRFIDIYEGNEYIIANILKTTGGYISEFGHELANWLKDMKITNGFTEEDESVNDIANGIDCLAAQCIAHFKKCVGYVYMTPSDVKAEYDYEIRAESVQMVTEGNADDLITITVHRYGEKIFEGKPSELAVFQES